MTARALLSDLTAHGVSLSVDAGRLAYDGPDDVLTDEVLDALAAHKSEMLALLSDRPAPVRWRHPRSLGHWPIAWRQAWADRAAELEDHHGLDWRAAERQAFLETAERFDPKALRELEQAP